MTDHAASTLAALLQSHRGDPSALQALPPRGNPEDFSLEDGGAQELTPMQQLIFDPEVAPWARQLLAALALDPPAPEVLADQMHLYAYVMTRKELAAAFARLMMAAGVPSWTAPALAPAAPGKVTLARCGAGCDHPRERQVPELSLAKLERFIGALFELEVAAVVAGSSARPDGPPLSLAPMVGAALDAEVDEAYVRGHFTGKALVALLDAAVRANGLLPIVGACARDVLASVYIYDNIRRRRAKGTEG